MYLGCFLLTIPYDRIIETDTLKSLSDDIDRQDICSPYVELTHTFSVFGVLRSVSATTNFEKFSLE